MVICPSFLVYPMGSPFPAPDAPMWVLLIEDEARLADSVRRGLEEEGFRVDVAVDAEEGERLALANGYDAFVVDWRLPKGDGKTLVERIRAEGREEPVLMLTALSDVEHRVAGLDAGADDYLPKPFAFEELVARLRALLRRPPLSDQERTITVGPLRLDGERRKVTMTGSRGEAVLNLRPKEYAMLEVFLRSADAALSRTVLAERVWGDALFVTDNALDVTISGLRQRLDDAIKTSGAEGAPWIETLRGVGYRLVPGAE
ncbi:MAG: response regulator transcription factor [Sandaracinaceae bacterium]